MPDTIRQPLTDDDLVRMEHRARRSGSGNCWTGQSGALAADVMRLLAERVRLLELLAEAQGKH